MEKNITGLHGIEEALKSGRITARLFISRKNARISAIQVSALKAGVEVINMPPADMNKRFGENNRGAVLQVFGEDGIKRNRKRSDGIQGGSPSESSDDFQSIIDSLGGTALVIILDGVTDPHNYGAILRSADQFGADLVVSRTRRSAGDSDTVARTSSGAVNYVSTAVVSNLARAVDYLKKSDFWIYAADMGGDELYKMNLKGRTAVIMGSEGKGVSRLLAEKSDGRISIPSKGMIDSLNVSVAAGVIMYEIMRQNSL